MTANVLEFKGGLCEKWQTVLFKKQDKPSHCNTYGVELSSPDSSNKAKNPTSKIVIAMGVIKKR